jgi:isoquinoline 1-oxidoreductase subunit beta
MIDEQLETESNEVERYELREPPRHRFAADRRVFVQTLGAGIVIAVGVGKARAQRGGRGRGGGDEEGTVAPARRFHIDRDGVVTAFTSKMECGQGARTEITQAVAEELRVPVDQVRLVMADTELCPDDGGTAGSRTTPATIPSVRRSAAQAREVLAAMAAAKLGVNRAALQADNGAFVDAESAKRITLAELATNAEFAADWTAAAPAEATITPVDEWRVLGTSVPKVTGRDVVTGGHQYPSDIRRPGMVYGKVLRPTAYGAKLTSIDLASVESMEGVTVVRDGDFVGCTAKTSWQAAKAIEALAATAKWDAPSHPSSDELFEHLKQTATTESSGWPQPRSREWGDGIAAMEKPSADSGKTYQAAYEIAYIQHAPMEPRAAVAEWEDGKVTVWIGTQQPSRARDELKQAFRLADDRVRVIVPDTGGGFGGKHTGEAGVEAARLAKAAGRPVSLRWTREEESTWAYCRPAGLIEVNAALDGDGALAVWDFTNYNSGESGMESPYRAPHGRVRFLAANSPLRQGSYRALASTANHFARESAIDDLAALAGGDPLEFRLKHLPDGRQKDVLVAAADKFKWRERVGQARNGRGVGLACGTEKGSFVAACVEVEYADGEIKVLHVCEAFECGAIINPQNIRAQIEGAIIQGLGGALYEAVTFKDGRVTNPRFSEYRVPRMADVPELDILPINRADLPSLGAGETPIIAVAPAIANAIVSAGGPRKRALPLLSL